MQGETKSKFPVSSQKYVVFFTVLLAALIFFGPYMTYVESQKLDLKILGLEQEIKEQTLFTEAINSLKVEILKLEKEIEAKKNLQRPGMADVQERAQGDEPPASSSPESLITFEKRGLSLRETTDIGTTLSAMAREIGLKALAIHPDVSSLTGSQEDIMVDARVSGSYKGLWTFLRELGSHPAFKEFVTMEIREIPQSREMHVKVRFYTED